MQRGSRIGLACTRPYQRIDTITRWTDNVINGTALWQIWLSTFMSYGPWYEAAPNNSTGYVGLRREVSGVHKYGWLKIELLANNGLEVLNWAYQE